MRRCPTCRTYLELSRRQNWRTLLLYRLKLVGVQSERLENGWSNLGGQNSRVNRARLEFRVRKQHDHVGVVVRETTVLFLFRAAAGVDHTVVGGDDDIRGARILAGTDSGGGEHRRE